MAYRRTGVAGSGPLVTLVLFGLLLGCLGGLFVILGGETLQVIRVLRGEA